ncbi:hypothetical protein Tco_0910886 [Tanacetum coccineum]|uniref:Retrovirus-related Pol polyprotein from transposon TNT 1-94-like beta-barrel domain-containing protein n=1 Tax=Tanacetum coccineum TaxID=301880 RepID=A0ABQ5CU73_9ASTR
MSNASVLQNEVLNKQRYLSDKSCIGFGVESSSGMESDNSSGNTNSTEFSYSNFQKTKGFHSVPPPTGPYQENTKSSQPEIDRNKVIIEDWVDSDDAETVLNSSDIQKKTILNSENSETSFENKSPSSQTSVGQRSRKTGLGTKGYPHQRRSFIPSAVLTREGLKSTARPKTTQTVPSKSTANVFYRGTARSRVPRAVLSQSTGRPYYPRLDNIRPRTSSFSPSSRSSTTRTPHRPQRPKKIIKSIWVKKASTVGSQTALPKIVSVKGSAMITQTWRPKGAYLDSVNRDNGSYTLKQFDTGNPEEDLKDYAIIDSGCSGSMTGDKDKLSDFKEFKGGYVAFGNDSKGGRISGKGTIKTSCLDIMLEVVVLRFDITSFEIVMKTNASINEVQRYCCKLQGTAEDTSVSQTSGGDEGLLDLYALNREVRRLKKQTLSQAKQIRKLKAKLKKLSKVVEPVVKHHAFWVESQNLKKQKRRRKKQRKKVSSVKLGRNNDEGNLSEEHHDQDDEGFDATVTPDFERKSDETEALERKSDETEQVNIEEEKDASNVKSGDTEELDLEEFQSTARQSAVTPRTLNFEDEAGPSSQIHQTQEEEPKEQFKDDELLADIILNRPRGLSIPGPMQSQPQQPTQSTDPKEKGKGILVEEPKKKKG